MTRTYSPKTAPIYQFKITLEGITPVIWRRFLVSSNITLDKLHDTIQIIMGWTNSHLHMFEVNGQVYGDPEDDEYGDLGTLDEATQRLRKILSSSGSRFRYEYDFGDSWWHTLQLEKILPPDPRQHLPVCLEGKRACPPEDVGGIGGYANFLEAIRDPLHEEHEEYLVWVGGEFNPSAFDLEKVNQDLRGMKPAVTAWQMDEYPSWPAEKKKEPPRPPTLNEEQHASAETLPLRRDMLTFLAYLKANRVTGTQSTGNFPLKDVHAICAQFATPPPMETRIGDHVFRVRSESEVWPLYFFHVLGSVGGLIQGSPGRRWQLTPVGEKFMTAPADIQVWLLFMTWWTQVNWAIAWSFSVDEFPSSHTRNSILECLLKLPEGQASSYELFADQVIHAAGLGWHHAEGDHDRTILHGLIEATVARPLEKLGVLKLHGQPHPIWGEEFLKVSMLTLTSLGKMILESQ
jgi:hypothetical protein